MVANTRLFGEVDIPEEKILHFAGGIVGFPDMKNFTLIYDAEKGNNGGIEWLQSMDEPSFAMPVMDPLLVKPDYNPMVEEELLKPLGELNEDNLHVLVTVTVPKEITKMSVNLQAPIVINVGTMEGAQLIVDNSKGAYPIKFPVYDILKARKEKGGE